MMHKPKTVQPITPTPQDDLQQISMLEDLTTGDDYRNLFSNRNNHNFIEGWIKPNKKNSSGFVSYKSNVLEVVSSTVPIPVAYSSQMRNRIKRGVNSSQTSRERPISSRYQMRRNNSRKWESQAKAIPGNTFNISDIQVGKNDNIDISFAKYKHLEPIAKPQQNKKDRKSSVQAVAFPLFTAIQNPQRIGGKTTAVGRIRRLMKVRLQKKK